jgi:NDP-sugar pyrophosphorylase family protein
MPAGCRAGVIAAGRGERLRMPGGEPKPLVPVAGRPLIDRVLASLAEVDPVQIVIIVNEESPGVRRHVDAAGWPFTVRWIVESTPSSMHSFLRVIETLASDGSEGPFLVSTVDTIAPARAFRAFAHASRGSDADVVLAVTAVAEDDKPLLVRSRAEASGRRRVEAIGAAAAGAAHMTAGYYSVRPTVLHEAEAARTEGLSALRVFFERLLDREYQLEAVAVPSGVDVDRPDDVGAAETFLRQLGA